MCATWCCVAARLRARARAWLVEGNTRSHACASAVVVAGRLLMQRCCAGVVGGFESRLLALAWQQCMRQPWRLDACAAWHGALLAASCCSCGVQLLAVVRHITMVAVFVQRSFLVRGRRIRRLLACLAHRRPLRAGVCALLSGLHACMCVGVSDGEVAMTPLRAASDAAGMHISALAYARVP